MEDMPHRDLSAWLQMIRLALGGAILGVSVSGIVSGAIGIPRDLPDIIAGLAGFAFGMLFQLRPRRNRA
jgi:hypothetical protein